MCIDQFGYFCGIHRVYWEKFICPEDETYNFQKYRMKTQIFVEAVKLIQNDINVRCCSYEKIKNHQRNQIP